MNLILTDKCTNSCPYCFAAMEMQRKEYKNSLSREDFDIFMTYVEKEKFPIEINIIGGEPLIYQDLEYIFDRLYTSNKVSHFTVFTGGIVSSSAIEKLIPYSAKCDLLFNINEKNVYRNPLHFEKVVKNLELSILSGLHTGIGFNIFHHDFDGNQIINLCHTYGVSHLRFSVACPVYNQRSNFVIPPYEYSQLANRVFDFLLKCHEKEIIATLDCPVPLCFFSDVQLGKLALIQPEVATRMEKCHAALDINYDLKIFRCFSLSDCTDVSLRDFGSFSEIRDFFAENIDSRLQRPAVFSQCATCTLVSRCNGGCLSNNGTFMDAPTKRELMTEIFAMISRNEIDDALVRLETIMPQTIAEKMLRAKLLLHVNRIEDAKRLLYFCANNASSTKIQNEALNIIKSL